MSFPLSPDKTAANKEEVMVELSDLREGSDWVERKSVLFRHARCAYCKHEERVRRHGTNALAASARLAGQDPQARAQSLAGFIDWRGPGLARRRRTTDRPRWVRHLLRDTICEEDDDVDHE